MPTIALRLFAGLTALAGLTSAQSVSTSYEISPVTDMNPREVTITDCAVHVCGYHESHQLNVDSLELLLNNNNEDTIYSYWVSQGPLNLGICIGSSGSPGEVDWAASTVSFNACGNDQIIGSGSVAAGDRELMTIRLTVTRLTLTSVADTGDTRPHRTVFMATGITLPMLAFSSAKTTTRPLTARAVVCAFAPAGAALAPAMATARVLRSSV